MKLTDIVNQLKAVLPKYTTDFSNVLSISSLARSGSVVTATTSSPHGLDNYKGVFATYDDLVAAYPTATTNDYAFVTATNTQWIYGGAATKAWSNTNANILSTKVLITGAKTPILISSLTQVNGYASAICATKHNLTKASTTVEISGADQILYNGNHNLVWTPQVFQIESITIDVNTNIATVTTVEDNGFVANANFEIEITGTAQAAYNRKTAIASIIDSKTFTIADVYGANEDGANAFGKLWQVRQILNAYTFIFEVDGAAISPATGTIYQVYEYQEGYNGYKTILSAPTPTTFTYAIDSAPLSPAQGSINAITTPNITGSVSLERAADFYTTAYNSDNSKKWMAVVLGDRIFSKSNFNSTDAQTYNANGDIIREMYYQDIIVYIFLPCGSVTDELMVIETVDLANDYFADVCHCLLGFAPPSGLTEAQFSRMSPTSSGMVSFNNAFYIYQITFQATNYINEGDAVAPADLSAFRTFHFDVLSNTDNQTNVMEIAGEVDQEN